MRMTTKDGRNEATEYVVAPGVTAMLDADQVLRPLTSSELSQVREDFGRGRVYLSYNYTADWFTRAEVVEG